MERWLLGGKRCSSGEGPGPAGATKRARRDGGARAARGGTAGSILGREVGGRALPRSVRYVGLARMAVTKCELTQRRMRRDGTIYPRRVGAVGCLDFDPDGYLLVAGAADGVVSVFNFDKVQAALCRVGNSIQSEVRRLRARKALSDEAEDEARRNAAVHRKAVSPVLRVEAGRCVSDARWNPCNLAISRTVMQRA